VLQANTCTGPGTTYYASPTGSGSSCTLASPCSLGTAAGKPKPGDIVCLRGGTYSSGLFATVSGTSTAWITFAAYPGELPIISSSTGVNVTGTYLSFNGIVSENASSGFANKWVGANATSGGNGNLEFVNCIADMNTANGIAFFSAQGVHIAQCIVAHNGSSTTNSWSSGVDIYSAQGSYTDNVVERTVSFENVDMQCHTDGSGFIADSAGTGSSFIDNIGFRNGGSCIRLTTAPNSHIINNTCYGDGLDPQAGTTNSASCGQGPTKPGEIFYSSASTLPSSVLENNLAVPASGQTAFVLAGTLPDSTDIAASVGSTPFFNNPPPDFTLTSAAAGTIVGKGSTSGAPSVDIGFDPKCIKSGSPGASAPSWWIYSIDYTYIASIGGVAQCFHAKTRSLPPDIGAYTH
jgi:hypothetical protein